MAPPSLDDRSHPAEAADLNKDRKASISSHTYGHYYKDMHTSMVKSKFLSNPEDLGVVAVGFSGGQVCLSPPCTSGPEPGTSWCRNTILALLC